MGCGKNMGNNGKSVKEDRSLCKKLDASHSPGKDS